MKCKENTPWNNKAAKIVEIWKTDRGQEIRRELVSSVITKGGTVLDAACGNCSFREALKGKYKSYLGIDWSIELLKFGKKNLTKKDSIVCADLRYLPIRGPFDLVLFIEVLRHTQPENGLGILGILAKICEKIIFTVCIGPKRIVKSYHNRGLKGWAINCETFHTLDDIKKTLGTKRIIYLKMLNAVCAFIIAK